MHVLYVNYHYDRDIPTPEDLLARYSSIRDWCYALRTAGVERISFVQHFMSDAKIEVENITYNFVQDISPLELKLGRIPRRIHAKIKELEPDIVHSGGWAFPLEHLAKTLGHGVPIVWQHHGGGTPHPLTSWLYERGMRSVDALFFTSREQVYPWREAGMIRENQLVYEVIESAVDISPLPHERYKEKLGGAPAPLFLSVGHLNANKDPLTVIQGFSQIAHLLPQAQLILVYQNRELYGPVAQMIEEKKLRDRVHLIQNVPHYEMAEYYSAADYFISGSHSEGSGYALMEAIACGATPIVTAIPPFRKITGNGAIGHLWTPGDPTSLRGALLRALETPNTRREVMMHFEKALSAKAIGTAAVNAYKDLMKQKRSTPRNEEVHIHVPV